MAAHGRHLAVRALTAQTRKHSDTRYGRRNAQGASRHDRARALAAGPAHGYAVIEEIRRRSRQAFDLPEGRSIRRCIVSSRPACCQSLGHRRIRAAAAGLRVDPARRARARRTPRGLAAIRRCHRRPARGIPAVGQAGMIPPISTQLAGTLASTDRCRDAWCGRSKIICGRRSRPIRRRDRLAAERRAIVNFGEPQLFAAQFAVVSLASDEAPRYRSRAGRRRVFSVMKARVAWYAALQWSMSEDARPLAAIVLTIDRFAFWLSAIVGIGALLYAGRRIPRASHRNIAGRSAARGSCVAARPRLPCR